MEQTEFKRALAKFEKQKKKRAEATLAAMGAPDAPKVNVALPFAQIDPVVKKDKPQEAPRPKPKAMTLTISGPINLSFSIEWAGHLLGGQMNEHSMKALFIQHLSPMGRVVPK